MNKKLMFSAAIAINSVLLMSGCSVSDQKDNNKSGNESTVEEKVQLLLTSILLRKMKTTLDIV